MTESWTDRHLDDLSRKFDQREVVVDEQLARIENRFDKLEDRFDSMQKEMTLGFKEIEREAARRHEAVTARFETQDQKMLYGILGLVGAFMTGFAGIMAVIATQL